MSERVTPVIVRNAEFATFDSDTDSYSTRQSGGGRHLHLESYGTSVFEGMSTEVTVDNQGNLIIVVNEVGAHLARLATNFDIMYGSQSGRRISEGLDFSLEIDYPEAYKIGRETPEKFPIGIPILNRDGTTDTIGIEKTIEITLEMIKRNSDQGFLVRYLRHLVGIGPGGMGVSTNATNKPEFILHGQWWPKEYMGKGVFENGMKVLVFEDPVVSEQRGTCDYAKTAANYGGKRTPLKNNANARGFNDALLIGRDRSGEDIVTELTSANILIVKDGFLITPKRNFMILPGITRNNILEVAKVLAKELGLTGVREEKITLTELLEADEAMVCGTAAKVTPLVKIGVIKGKGDKIEEITIGDGKAGKITRSLQAAYFFIERGSQFAIEEKGETRLVDSFVNRATGIKVSSRTREEIEKHAEGVQIDQKYDTRFRRPNETESKGLRRMKMVA